MYVSGAYGTIGCDHNNIKASDNTSPYYIAQSNDTSATKHWGIFGQVNNSATFSSIRDGSSNVFMVGELQKFTSTTSNNNMPIADLSQDGWAVGGSATLFSTGQLHGGSASSPMYNNSLLNNGHFASPGSDHSNGAQFSMGDASVRFVSNSVNLDVFALQGSMADGVSAIMSDN